MKTSPSADLPAVVSTAYRIRQYSTTTLSTCLRGTFLGFLWGIAASFPLSFSGLSASLVLSPISCQPLPMRIPGLCCVKILYNNPDEILPTSGVQGADELLDSPHLNVLLLKSGLVLLLVRHDFAFSELEPRSKESGDEG